MGYRGPFGNAAVVLGVVVLYSGWWNLRQLLYPGGPCPGHPNPHPGVHLNGFGAVVYGLRECGVVYDGAWLVFLVVSVTGLALLGGGAWVLDRAARPSTATGST